MKNMVFSTLIKPRKLGVIALLTVILLIVGGMTGCNKTAPGSAQPAEDNTELTDKTAEKPQQTKEESIDAYNKSQGYQVAMNSGIGCDIYVPKKERENNQAFFDGINEQSRSNGYDFSSYLDKPLQYVSMAIEGNDTAKDVSFLCYQEQIVGVWTDASNEDCLAARRILLQYNFVYDTEELFKYKSAYVGDNSNVMNLMYTLPYDNGVKPTGCELQTDNEPYGIIINCQGYGTDGKACLPFLKNAAVIFNLIDNVGVVTFNVQSNDGIVPFEFTRAEIEAYFQKDVRKCAENKADFEAFIQEVLDYTA